MLQSVLVLLIMSGFAFALINAAPGDPAAAIYGGQMDQLTPAERERINTNLGLDQPLVPLRQLASGDRRRTPGILLRQRKKRQRHFGAAPTQHPPAVCIVLYDHGRSRIGDWVMGGHSSGLPAGPGITVASIVVNGIPSVLVAIGLIFLFSVQLGILPSSGTASLFTGGAAGPAAPSGAAGDHHRPQPCGLLCPVYPGGNEGGAEQLLRDGGSGQPGLQKGSLLGGHEKRPGPLCQLRRHPMCPPFSPALWWWKPCLPTRGWGI